MKTLGETSTVREQIEATTRAVIAVDQGYVCNAIWQRRGLLQRLTRVEPAASLEIASATRTPLFATTS